MNRTNITSPTMLTKTILSLLPAFSSALGIPNPALHFKRQLPNLMETVYCARLTNLPACTTAFTLSNTALEVAQEDWPGPTGHNGPGDAFRHCFWSGLMVIKLGIERAKVFGEMHEEGDEDVPAEKDMDLVNNERGRVFGVGQPNTDEGEWEVQLQCDKATREGRLVTICGGKGQEECKYPWE